MDLSGVQLASMAATLGVAAVFDIRERRVPNWLTYGATVAALGWQAWTGSVVAGLWGALACGVIGILLYVISRLGAGDAKLLIAVGAWLGVGLGLDVALWTLLGGAIVAIVMLLVRGQVLSMLRELWVNALTLSTPGTRPIFARGNFSFPLAPVMALAFALVVLIPALRPASPIIEALR
jgi:prepilin peptidase CpaA